MSKIEILKDSDPKKIAQWERAHDKRNHYRCERCGAEWKCEYFEIPSACTGKGPELVHIENPAVASYCNKFKEKGATL